MTISASAPTRVVVLLAAIAVVLVLLAATALGSTGGDATAAGEVAFTTHRVASGDTLWDIAADHTDPGDDVRRTVHEIRSLNDLDGSIIQPGQVLRIPHSG